MARIVTRAMQKNALRALGIENDGSVATVLITPNAVVVAHVREAIPGDGQQMMAWTDYVQVGGEA